MKPLVLLGVCVLIACAAYAIAIMVALANWPDRAAFGDMFGAPTAVFSALAFVAVAYALLLQLKQLKAQERSAAITQSQMQSQEEDARETRALLERTAKLNALSTLAETYSDALSWMEDQQRRHGIDKSGPMARVSRLHGRVISEVEQLCEIEDGLYVE